MSLLDRWPSERREFRDHATGTRIWQMTAHPADHHPLMAADSSFTPTGEHLLFTSDRAGGVLQLFRLEISTGEIVQVTETDDLRPDPITPAADGSRAIACLAIQNSESEVQNPDGEVAAIDLETGEGETLAVFLRAGLDGCHLSASGEYVVTTVTQDEETTITAVHTEGMRTVPILEAPGAGSARFSPDSKNSVLYVRRSPPTIHCVEFDSSGDRALYTLELPGEPTRRGERATGGRGEPAKATADLDLLAPSPRRPVARSPRPSPTWLGSGDEIIVIAGVADGPILAVPRPGGEPRVISPHRCRWARSNTAGDRIVAVVDNGEGPGIGAAPVGAHIVLLDPKSGDLHPLVSLRGAASCPAFSPDGRSVVYSDSDEHGHSQLFIVGT